jgi:hypothetical protein
MHTIIILVTNVPKKQFLKKFLFRVVTSTKTMGFAFWTKLRLSCLVRHIGHERFLDMHFTRHSTCMFFLQHPIVATFPVRGSMQIGHSSILETKVFFLIKDEQF